VYNEAALNFPGLKSIRLAQLGPAEPDEVVAFLEPFVKHCPNLGGVTAHLEYEQERLERGLKLLKHEKTRRWSIKIRFTLDASEDIFYCYVKTMMILRPSVDPARLQGAH